MISKSTQHQQHEGYDTGRPRKKSPVIFKIHHEGTFFLNILYSISDNVNDVSIFVICEHSGISDTMIGSIELYVRCVLVNLE